MPTVSGNATSFAGEAGINPWAGTSNGTGAPDGVPVDDAFNDDNMQATAGLAFEVPLTVPDGAIIRDVSVAAYRWGAGFGVEDFGLTISFKDANNTEYVSGDLHHTGDWGTTPGTSDSYGGDANALFGSYPVNSGGTSCHVFISIQAYHPVGGIAAASNALVDAVSAAITYDLPPQAGTSTLNLHPSASANLESAKSASATFNLSPTASANVDRSVSASSSLALASSGSSTVDRVVSASSGLILYTLGTGHIPATHTVIASSSLDFRSQAPFRASGLDDPPGAGYVNLLRVTASSRLNLSPVASAIRNSVISVAARSALHLSPVASAVTNRILSVSASSTLNLTPAASNAWNTIWSVSARSVIGLSSTASTEVNRVLSVAAASAIRFSTFASETPNRTWLVSASSTLNLSPGASRTGVYGVSAGSVLNLSPVAGPTNFVRQVSATASLHLGTTSRQNRDINVSASVGLGFSAGDTSNRFLAKAASSSVAFVGAALGTVAGQTASSSLILRSAASASVTLPNGSNVPGGDTNTGLSACLYECSGGAPFTFTETPLGLLLMANGIDPMLRWDGMAQRAEPAGVLAPTEPCLLGGSGVGVLTGTRYAFVRFIDRYGNPSNLSPVSNGVPLGRDGLIDDIAQDSAGLITVRSDGHGLATGEQIVFRGVQGLEGLNGVQTITVTDGDHFTVDTFRFPAPTHSPGLLPANVKGIWTQGGSWTWGVANVVYGGVPVPSEAKVVRRQILRNLEGDLDALYVDVDTTDLSAATFSSSRSDESLSAQEAVEMSDFEERPLAHRFGVPPSHKAVVVSHQGRVFAAVDRSYSEGCLTPVVGQDYIQGIGTNWPANFAGRLVYVAGASAPYEIARVDVPNQRLYLGSAGSPVVFSDPVNRFTSYVIRPAPAERKLVHFSEPGSPEAWPASNAFSVPEDGDTVTGLMSRGAHLFVLEGRHVYRFTYQGDPGGDGNLYLASRRGAVNHRVVAQVEGIAYMLDDAGVHAFDGGSSTPISDDIQVMFREGGEAPLRLDWSADTTLWHASFDPSLETIRWFVQVVGSTGLYHALCYNYRSRRWWVEQYPTEITSSASGRLGGHGRALAGTDARRVICLGEGELDGVAGSGTLRGTVTAATATTLTDSTASFGANLGGASVSIAEGTGRGQTAIISSNTSAVLTLLKPWETIPDSSSVYQIGGVPWSWRSGWLEFVEDESDNPRDIALVYQPLAGPGTMDLQLYFDHRSDPRAWGYTSSQDGVSVTDGSPAIQIDMRDRDYRPGYSTYRHSGHGDRDAYGDLYLSLGLSGVKSAETTRIYQVTVKGVVSPTE